MPTLQGHSTPVFWLVTNQMRYKRVHIATSQIRAIQDAMADVDYVLPSLHWQAEQVYCYAEADAVFAPKRLTVLVRRGIDGFTELQTVVVSQQPLSQENMSQHKLVLVSPPELSRDSVNKSVDNVSEVQYSSGCGQRARN